jgi:hypothetical protein
MRRNTRAADRPAEVITEVEEQFWASKNDAVIVRHVQRKHGYELS